jgi:hypothetical protein
LSVSPVLRERVAVEPVQGLDPALLIQKTPRHFVADARNDGLRNAIKPGLYIPYSLQLRMFTQILVRAPVPRCPCCTMRGRIWSRSIKNNR